MKRGLLFVLLALVLVGAIGWSAIRGQRIQSYRKALREASATSDAVLVQGRFYRAGELLTAAAPVLYGPKAPQTRSVEPPFNDPIAAIADFRDRLAEEGVELWVLPAPVRPWVAPVEVGGTWPPRIYADAYNDFLADLRDEGVITIDILPPLRTKALYNPKKYVHRTDPHWTGDGVVLVAELLADRVRAQSWHRPERSIPTTAQWRHVNRNASAGGIQLPDEPDEKVRVRRIREVIEGNKKGRSVSVDQPRAQILLMGDSHARWYDRYGADIARQLTHELGQPIDALPIVGGGSTRVREEFARRVWADPDYLPTKKVVIWTFWTEILWSQPWGDVPLEPFEASKLDRRDQEPRASSDLHVVERGRGLAGWDYRWRPPAPGDEHKDVTWIRKPDIASMSFPADLQAPASMIVELKATRANPVEATFDRVPLPPVNVHIGYNRVRWPLPLSKEKKHTLKIGISAEPRPTNALGIRNLIVVTSQPVWTEPFDPDPDRFPEFVQEGGKSFPKVESLLRLEPELPALPQGAIVRMRLRGLGRHQTISLQINDTWVLQDQDLPRDWSEQAIEVPANAWREGINVLEWTTSKPVAWNVVEIDAP